MRKKNRNGFSYRDMFLQDISTYIQFSIGKYKEYEKNVDIKNINGNFREYFTYNDFGYLRYDLLKEIAELIVKVIDKGNAIALIVSYKDANGETKGIELRNPSYLFYYKGLKNTYLVRNIMGYGKKKYKIEKVNNKEIIYISSINLNINRLRMKKILKKLEKDKTMKLLNLSTKQLLQVNEFKIKKEKNQINLFKITGYMRWEARDHWSEFLNSPYILYRTVAFRNYLIKLVKKTTGIINKKISKNYMHLDAKGEIVIKLKDINKFNSIMNTILEGKGEYETLTHYMYYDDKAKEEE